MRTSLSSTRRPAGSSRRVVSKFAALLGIGAALALSFAAPAEAKAPVIKDGKNNIVTSAAFVLYAGFHTRGGECSVGARSAQCTTGQFAGTRVIITKTGYYLTVSVGPVAEGYGVCGPGYWNAAQEEAYGICNIGISSDMNRNSNGDFIPGETADQATCTTNSAKLTYGFPTSNGSHSSSTKDGAC